MVTLEIRPKLSGAPPAFVEAARNAKTHGDATFTYKDQLFHRETTPAKLWPYVRLEGLDRPLPAMLRPGGMLVINVVDLADDTRPGGNVQIGSYRGNQLGFPDTNGYVKATSPYVTVGGGDFDRVIALYRAIVSGRLMPTPI